MNNKSVWNIIRAVTHNTEAWSVVINQYARSKHGRGAYHTLFDHYGGRIHVTKIKLKSKAVIEKIFGTVKPEASRGLILLPDSRENSTISRPMVLLEPPRTRSIFFLPKFRSMWDSMKLSHMYEKIMPCLTIFKGLLPV